MKIALVYTAKTDNLERKLTEDARRIAGTDVEIATYQDLSALEDSASAGYVAAGPAARYAKMIMTAIDEGADAVLSTCCFMGDVVLALEPFAALAGTPLASIDEEMCRQAIIECDQVVLLFTAPVAGAAVHHTFERMEQKLRRRIDMVEMQVNATGSDPDENARKFAEQAAPALAKADGLILAQPSMAAVAPCLRRMLGKKVYCAPDDGMDALRRRIDR